MSGDPAFRLEPFTDYLSFERGLSDRTLTAYQKDLEKLLAVRELVQEALPGEPMYGFLPDAGVPKQ